MKKLALNFILMISSFSLTLDFSDGPYGSEYFDIAGPFHLDDLNAVPQGDVNGDDTLNIQDIKETFKHDIDEILKETLAHEQKAISVYYELLDLVQDKSVYLEEYARSLIGEEEQHQLELKKMLIDFS